MHPYVAALIARLSVGKINWQNILVKTVDIATRPPLNERLDQISEIQQGQQLTHDAIAHFEVLVDGISEVHQERRENIAELKETLQTIVSNQETMIANQQTILTRINEVWLIEGPRAPKDDQV